MELRAHRKCDNEAKKLTMSGNPLILSLSKDEKTTKFLNSKMNYH